MIQHGTFTIEFLNGSIAAAYSRNQTIVLHPNGFLQLFLHDDGLDRYQIHVWSPLIQRRGDTMFEIHDHAFRIDSYVVIGSLLDLDYTVKEDESGDYTVFRSDGFGQLVSTNIRVSASQDIYSTIQPKSMYIIPKECFHCSRPKTPTVMTLVRKSEHDPQYRSQVLAPITYMENRIQVDRTIDQDLAWRAIFAAQALAQKEWAA